MSGPYGPNSPGPGEGGSDPTQQWTGQQPGPAGPTQQWGGQQPPPAPPQQQFSGEHPAMPPQQQWGAPPPQQQPTEQGAQWGPATAPPQQWGQSQPSGAQPMWQGTQSHSGEWGQPGPMGSQPWNQQQWQQGVPARKGTSKGLLIGLGLLVVAAIAGGVGALLWFTATDELDQSAVQDGVSSILSESYGIKDADNVSCPSGQKVEVDATFSCDLQVSGEDKTVNIKITKDDGTYEVGRPS